MAKTKKKGTLANKINKKAGYPVVGKEARTTRKETRKKVRKASVATIKGQLKKKKK